MSHKLLKPYFKDQRFKRLYESVKSKFEEVSPIAHNWDHVYRDLINAIKIGEAESADMGIVLPAVVLHDIGFLYDPNPSVHHTLGAEKCFEWLDDWDKSEQGLISKCIERHKGKVLDFKIEPETLEERVVYDSDALEKVGYIGIAQGVRTFVEFAETAKPEFKSMYEISKILSSVNDIKLYTETAKKIAEERGGVIFPKFFEDLKDELEEYYE